MRRVFIGPAASLALSLTLALSAIAGPETANLNASSYITPNADGTASFEFRVANDRRDITVTGFTVTVTFYDRTVAPSNKLAEYHWSFLGKVPPNTQLLEYGVLGADAVADLVKRHPAAAGRAAADLLATAVYSCEAKVDSQTAVPNN